ncbi:regulator of nonsense transcripts 3A [Adelges cooleyi]|uniref:regulator of nonsense transcripts 3A n=1 Tax=Adelges cooleyi TaxID=133065 RepID=UPI00217FFA8E|nr:regulator of nonsense transcripts 3A [Adelges cooleyi]
MLKESNKAMKGPEKVDEFLLSLFKSLEKQKSKEDRRSIEKKVVVRRLPPSMTEERFLNEVSPLPENNYIYFVPGDLQATPFHHSRVYINFLKEEDMYMFTDKFDGYVFVDDTGDEYPAIVELAPYQRVPKKKLDKDPNWGKIHENPVFLEFKHNFEQKTIDTTLKTTQHFFESVEDKSEEQDLSTPLLEYLAKQNDRQRLRVSHRDERRKKVFSKKKEKEEIRRIKKEEREIVIKQKPIVKPIIVSKKIIDEKPLKDTKKIIKSHRENACDEEDKKKSTEDCHHKKNEFNPKGEEVKKIEFNVKSISKLNEFKKNIDDDLKEDVFTRADKNHEYYKDKSEYESKKKTSTLKNEYFENKNIGTSRYNKHRDEQNHGETKDIECTKQNRSDVDKKSAINKRVDNRRHESKIDRRIRNKDRPAIEIYRPGMGRLSKLKADNEVADSESKN